MIGHVLDASVVDAIVTGHPGAAGWLSTARALSTPLYVPALAMTEVRTVRVDPARLQRLDPEVEVRPL